MADSLRDPLGDGPFRFSTFRASEDRQVRVRDDRHRDMVQLLAGAGRLVFPDDAPLSRGDALRLIEDANTLLDVLESWERLDVTTEPEVAG